ncbi:MAG: ASKHA domain-containing protein [Candidatus Thermoplasmatota archaeon]
MPMEERGKARVAFRPDGRSAVVEPGTTVLEAARAAGLHVDAVCDGEGKCGRCKVRVSGPHRSEESTALSEEERRAGILLACRTFVDGDVEVELLPRSLLGRHQIVTESVERPPRRTSPWTRKRYAVLSPPTLSDNTADLERVLKGIGWKGYEVPLETLRGLPGTVRAGGWKVTATISTMGGASTLVRVEPGDTQGRLLGIAVDIGTTTIVVSLLDLRTGEVLGTASDYNRQVELGEDVIARMMHAEEHGMGELTRLARDTINACVDTLLRKASTEGRRLTEMDVSAASLAGNTVMTQLFLGVSTDHVRLEPYVPVAHDFPTVTGREAGLLMNPAGAALMFPCRAGYVGGDVVADVLASGMHRAKGPQLLIDVGTNGEMVLGGKDWMVTCSCSAGPAFEGGEVSAGMCAMDGAMDRLRLNDDLSTSYHVIGGGRPSGICGSGLIDLLAEMYSHGVIDRKARIQDLGGPRVRSAEEGMEYVVETRDNLVPGSASDLVITDADLENILHTKAAIYGACSVLLRKTDHRPEDLEGIIIAGGFGYHLDIERAVSLGMFPDVDRRKYRFIGNGSLAGARLALLSERSRREMRSVVRKMTYLELSVDNEFYEEYSSSLFIPHTDTGRFPTAEAHGPHGGAR